VGKPIEAKDLRGKLRRGAQLKCTRSQRAGYYTGHPYYFIRDGSAGIICSSSPDGVELDQTSNSMFEVLGTCGSNDRRLLLC
jgi:hypothetical protein